MIGSFACALLGITVAATPLANGDFRNGLHDWSVANTWFERPKGAGLSEIRVAPGEGYQGASALKILGNGKRGIALQSLSVFPGRFRVTGWVKCENLTEGRAEILAEWLGRDRKYLRGDVVGETSGTADWRHIDRTIEAPPEARTLHLDLLTTEPNRGTVWFSHVTLERIPSNFPEPTAPALSASTPTGQDGCLGIAWDPNQLAAGTCRLVIYCQEGAFQEPLPKLVVDSDQGKAVLESLESGRSYTLSAVAVNGDGKRSPMGPKCSATPNDCQAPRPGWIEARRSGSGSEVRVSWSPHVLDKDIKRIHIGPPSAAPGVIHELASIDVTGSYNVARPFYCTEPWGTITVHLRPGVGKVGVWCEDCLGNRGETAWTDVLAAAGCAPGPWALWTAPPTDQVRRDAPAPAATASSFDLLLMQGQAKGFQVMVRPTARVEHARMAFDSLVHEDGHARIDPVWQAYHFVNYVEIQKNSCTTSKDHLVWPGPSEYPDELSDDRLRDLPAGQVQPIYVRVTAPRGTKPGVYRGTARFESDQGCMPVAITVRVSPIALPEREKLTFLYWMSWGDPCKAFQVKEYSADGWRVLSRLGELMRAHHQNSVVVPWNLIHSWRRADGTLMHDFTHFDRFVRVFQAEGVDRLFCLGHMGSRETGDWLCPKMVSHRHEVRSIDTGDSQRIDVVEILPAIERHLKDQRWLDRFSVHVADEPIPQNLASYRELSARVAKAAPRLRRIDAIHVPDLDGSLEIWVPQLNYFEKWLDQYRAAMQKAAGQQLVNELWFYTCWVPQVRYPNRMIDSFAIKARVLHWLGPIYDTTGYLHWALNHWHIPLTSLQSPGDQYICWPSRRFIANSSLRYEAEREGLEDGELMFLVREAFERQKASRADAQMRMETIARKAVRSFQDYTRSWRDLEQIREVLLEAAANPTAKSP